MKKTATTTKIYKYNKNKKTKTQERLDEAYLSELRWMLLKSQAVSQPGRPAGRPVPCSQYECGPADVEAYQCRAEAVSISLWCYSPLITPWGPRRSEYVTFALLF